MGSNIELDQARRRRAVTRFCTQCRTPWALRAVIHDDYVLIACKSCGHIRAAVPLARPASDETAASDDADRATLPDAATVPAPSVRRRT